VIEQAVALAPTEVIPESLVRLALDVADSALRIRRFFERAGPYPFPKNPGVTSQDLEPSVQAIVLERRT